MKQWTSTQIKALRKRYRITQRALGELSGVSTNYIYLLERGAKEPSKTLRLLLDCIEKEKGKGGNVKRG